MHQLELLRYVIGSLDGLGCSYMLVGSFASGTFGEPRFTQDIDIVIELPLEQIRPFCGLFPPPDFFVSEAAVRDAVVRRFQFNVLHPESGNKIDFMLPRDDAWGRSQLQRSIRMPIGPSLEGFVGSPEDVILGKMWYYSEGQSEKHLRDIAGILRLTPVDRHAIEGWAGQLGLLEVWRKALEREAS